MKTLYREISSGKVAAVFENCDTTSVIWLDPTKYTRETTELDAKIEILPVLSPNETFEDKIRRIAREEIAAAKAVQ